MGIMIKKENNWILCLLSGFRIAFLSALFVILGVCFTLWLLENWQLQKEILVIYTSIFYGIIYFIARAGVRVKSYRQNANLNEKNLKDKIESPFKIKSLISRVRIIAWYFFWIFSILWLTPAAVIYWASPLHPNRIIMLFAFILSLATASIYFIENIEKFLSITNRLIFYLGACLGSIITIYIFSLLYLK